MLFALLLQLVQLSAGHTIQTLSEDVVVEPTGKFSIPTSRRIRDGSNGPDQSNDEHDATAGAVRGTNIETEAETAKRALLEAEAHHQVSAHDAARAELAKAHARLAELAAEEHALQEHVKSLTQDLQEHGEVDGLVEVARDSMSDSAFVSGSRGSKVPVYFVDNEYFVAMMGQAGRKVTGTDFFTVLTTAKGGKRVFNNIKIGGGTIAGDVLRAGALTADKNRIWTGEDVETLRVQQTGSGGATSKETTVTMAEFTSYVTGKLGKERGLKPAYGTAQKDNVFLVGQDGTVINLAYVLSSGGTIKYDTAGAGQLGTWRITLTKSFSGMNGVQLEAGGTMTITGNAAWSNGAPWYFVIGTTPQGKRSTPGQKELNDLRAGCGPEILADMPFKQASPVLEAILLNEGNDVELRKSALNNLFDIAVSKAEAKQVESVFIKVTDAKLGLEAGTMAGKLAVLKKRQE